ncbi:splicing factor 3B subunit 2 [Pelobates cultripes]|uniref:Splicing factor 3B subunit 2 n=1 Tax=Pelobates cultripes TaxID=61616 RepID=A0AAD1THU7_PELCU|nr:splicing factor 3B subunit 2 [Pelobates cultripes]
MGIREELIDRPTNNVQVREENELSTAARLAQMAGMPLSGPPPSTTLGLGFPLGLTSRINSDSEGSKPQQATLLEQDNSTTRSLLLPRGNLPIASSIPPLLPTITRPRVINQPPTEELRESDDSSTGPKIPQVLEKILQLKEIRQEEMVSIPVTTEEEDDMDYNQAYTASETEEESTAPSKKEVRILLHMLKLLYNKWKMVADKRIRRM